MPFSKCWSACLLTLLVSLLGCVSKPVTYLGTYGEYKDRNDSILQVIEDHGLEVRWLNVAPPAGVSGSIIIHGRSDIAKTTATDLAYSLYLELGEWVAVRSVEVTNHRYSPDYIGVYLMDRSYGDKNRENEKNAMSVVGTNVYEVTSCEKYVMSLTLGDSNEYSLDGMEFDSRDRERPVSVVGEYRIDGDKLTIEYAGEAVPYRRELVQYSGETMSRIVYTPILTNDRGNNLGGCGFIQLLDVMIRE